jgi:hypothetical protein
MRVRRTAIRPEGIGDAKELRDETSAPARFRPGDSTLAACSCRSKTTLERSEVYGNRYDVLKGGEQRGKDLLEGGEQKGPALLLPKQPKTVEAHRGSA